MCIIVIIIQYYFLGSLMGGVMYYSSLSPIDFYLDIWRPRSDGVAEMIHTHLIEPNPTGQLEVSNLC